MVVTNAVGAVFAATLLSVGDAGATFVFPEDGATNTLALSQLSKESARRVCEAAGYVPVPPALAATFDMAKRDLARIEALLADDRMDADAARTKRARVFETFRRVCREKGLGESDAERLRRALLR